MNENKIQENWEFDDVKFYLNKLHEKQHNKFEVLPIINDIFKYNTFDSLQTMQLKDLLKRYFKINKQEQKEMTVQNNELTHIQIADDFIVKYFNKENTVYSNGSLWNYNDGIYYPRETNSLESEIGRLYSNFYLCRRSSDYKAISELVLRELLNNNFFETAPIGLASKSYFYTIKDNNFLKLPYSKDLRQRFKLNYDPDFSKDMPIFQKYLDTTFPNDKIQQNILQEIFGSIITGCANKFQKVFLLYGLGGNGKSTFLDILKLAIPKELISYVMPDMFNDEYYIIQLQNKLLNIGSDINNVCLPSNFKIIVSSDNEIMAREIYKSPIKFKSTATHIYSTNQLIDTKDKTNGFFRRWLIVNFKHTIDSKEKIYNLASKIVAKEMPQIIAWGLKGVKRLFEQNGFTESLEHEQLLSQWKNKDISGSILEFINENFSYNDNYQTHKSYIYPLYLEWCEQNNFIPLTNIKASRIIKENFTIITINGYEYIKNIQLKTIK